MALAADTYTQAFSLGQVLKPGATNTETESLISEVSMSIETSVITELLQYLKSHRNDLFVEHAGKS